MKKEQVRAAISKLKRSEKLELCCGGFVTRAVPRADVKSVDLGEPLLPVEPTTLALGCSFSKELCAAVSSMRIHNAKAAGYATAGAVGAGLITEPMKPDAVDYFSEDPRLTAELLRSYTAGDFSYIYFGALGQGEYNVRTVDARALREVYLHPLRIAGRNAAGLIIDGGTLNGERVELSRKAFDGYAEYLRDDAVVISRGDSVAGAYILCDNAARRKLVKKLDGEITAGTLHESMIDKTAGRMLSFVARCEEQARIDDGENDIISNSEIFAATTALLENSVLPVQPDARITFFGDGEYFDDCEKFDVKDVSNAASADGFAVFLVTDYADGVDGRTRDAIAACADKGNAIVVLCGGAATEIDFSDNVGSILFCPYIPELSALEKLLRGELVPQGRLPFTWCKTRKAYPRNNARFDNRGDYRYESVYNGYAYFNNFEPGAVMFPFGHGLDYTKFGIKAAKATCRERTATVEFDVTNVGARQGTALVQAYLTYCGEVYGLSKRFAGAARVSVDAGETKRGAITIELCDFDVFDEKNNAFVPVCGKFNVALGFSSADICASVSFKTAGDGKVVVDASASELPTYYGNGSGGFHPSAPELERLFGVPFLSKPNVVVERPRVSKLAAWKMNRRLNKRLRK